MPDAFRHSNRIREFAPVSAAERIDVVDVLRGFALFGILLVNIAFFAYPVSEPYYLAPDADRFDRAVHWLTAVLAQGKFYPLFSFLFGLGFAIQLERARKCRIVLEHTYVRRMFALLVIGLLHGLFIWAGDILLAYAVLGFVLLLLGRVTPRRLLALALAALLAQLSLIGTLTAWLSGVHADPEHVEALLLRLTAGMNEATALRAAAWEAYATGNYAEITVVRMREYAMALQNMVFFSPQVLGMFLLGAWCGRRGVLAHPHAHRRLLRRLMVAGIVVGLPLSLLFARLNAGIDYLGEPTVAMGKAFMLNITAGVIMALSYTAAVTLAMQTRMARALRVLAPVGRMALTNYLLQSVICTLVFYSYGLGQFGRVSATGLVGVVLLVFIAQVAFSVWWMMRFRFGPVEWLWRSVTYLRFQPMRLDAPARRVADANG